MLQIKDPLGTSFELNSTPQRIISLVPSLTETLYDLGLEDKIVGITKFCEFPVHFKSTKKIIGGTKKVHFEKIRLLQPDFIIANKEENTEEIVLELRKICPVWVTNIVTIEDTLQTLIDFGEIFNCRTEARKWVDKIAFGHTDFLDFRNSLPVRKTVYFIWKNPYMVAGSGTFIDQMLQLNHLDNCYKNQQRYPEITIESMKKEGNPELVLLSSEPFPFKDEDVFEIESNTPNVKTMFVDGTFFSWYGTRLHHAFSYFKQLHRELK